MLKFLPKISVIAFMFSFLHAFIIQIPSIFYLSYIQNDLFEWFFIFLAFLFSPIFLFVVMYFIGKKIELKAELPSISLNLILVSWLGSYLGSSVGYYLRDLTSTLFNVPLQVYILLIAARFITGVQSCFFPSIAAMAIAYLRRKTTATQ